MPPRSRVVTVRDAEIAVEQLDYRQPGRRLAVRNRVSLENLALRSQRFAELEKQPRLAGACLGDQRDDLPFAAHRQFERASHPLQLPLAADEFVQAAPHRHLESLQGSEPGDFKRVDRIADAFDCRRPQRPHFKITLDQPTRPLTYGDRTGGSQRLQPGGEIGGVPDRGIFQPPPGFDRAHDHFAAIDSDPHLDGRLTQLCEPLGMLAQLLLHLERRIEPALRMVLVGDRRAEDRVNAVAGRMHDIAFVTAHRPNHDPQRRVDDRARLLGVEVRHQFRRAFDVRKQGGDHLSLAVDRLFADRGVSDLRRRGIVARRRRRS